MYKAIAAEPSAFLNVISENKDGLIAARKQLRSIKRIFLVGTGTSFHAALAGQYLFSSSKGNPEVIAVPSFNFALYPPKLRKGDCVLVISHRGTKRYSVKSLEYAHRERIKTILITGKSAAINKKIPDHIFYTVDQEASSAHTISYVSALAILCSLANGTFTPSGISLALRKCQKLEPQMKAVANRIKNCRHVWIAGGGPSEITSQEIALKIKETSYMQAEGMGIETLFHGPFQSASSRDFFILIAPDGNAKGRVLELIPAIKRIGAKYLVIGNSNKRRIKNWYQVPKVKEEYTCLSCILPLQLLTYHLSLARHTDPDAFRLDNPSFASAEKFMKL